MLSYLSAVEGVSRSNQGCGWLLQDLFFFLLQKVCKKSGGDRGNTEKGDFFLNLRRATEII